MWRDNGMITVIRKKGEVMVLWNNRVRILSVVRERGADFFLLEDGRKVRVSNPHLVRMIRRRLGG
jgi:hypothetical protein